MTAYYNENDPRAAAWLRELIKQGHIAPGDVDERSIQDVSAGDLRGYVQCHFFAGIGVWSHALRRAGWGDDREVWTGSCPCQPFSSAGQRKGVDDDRHLWPVWFSLIAERRPRVVFGEQVASKDGLGWLDLVHADLEGAGYACGALDLCAAGFGAPHIRQRLYFVADAACGMADAEGRDQRRLVGNARSPAGKGHREAWPTHGDANRGAGADGELADAEHAIGRAQRLDGQDGRDGEDGGRQEAHRLAGACGQIRELADANGDRRAEAGERLGPGPTNGVWGDAEWLLCRDGKWRPVEPGTFPLAHGSPARVGRLRGYGNAIVAPQAQGFIEAYMAVGDEALVCV